MFQQFYIYMSLYIQEKETYKKNAFWTFIVPPVPQGQSNKLGGKQICLFFLPINYLFFSSALTISLQENCWMSDCSNGSLWLMKFLRISIVILWVTLMWLLQLWLEDPPFACSAVASLSWAGGFIQARDTKSVSSCALRAAGEESSLVGDCGCKHPHAWGWQQVNSV